MRQLTFVLILTLAGSLSSCTTPGNKTAGGAAIGAAGGAVVGGLMNKKNRGKGALVGALAGAAVGGAIGNSLDKQAKELAEVTETKRTKTGIITKMKGDLLFKSGKAEISPGAKTTLTKLAKVIVKYPEDHLVVSGHTDNTGNADGNMKLSQLRAEAVKAVLVSNGIPGNKIVTEGKGRTLPLADNGTSEGRAKNRRVEINITIPEEGAH